MLLLAQVVDLLKVLGEVEHHALTDEARAELGEDQGHDDRIPEDLPHEVAKGQGRVLGGGGVGAIPGVEVRVAGMAGAVAHQEPVHGKHEGHGGSRHEPDDRPAAEASQQPGSHGGGQEIAGADHDAEDAAEDAPLLHVEPGAVHLHHRQGPEALEVHVQAPEQAHAHQDPGDMAVQEHEPDEQIQQGRAKGTHEDGPAPAETIGQRAVQGHGQPVGPEACRGDETHLRLVQVVPRADVVLHDIEVVAAHVHGRIGQPQGEPVQEPAQAKGGTVLQGNLDAHRLLEGRGSL